MSGPPRLGPYCPGQIVWGSTVYYSTVQCKIAPEPSQPSFAVQGGLLDRRACTLRLHAADERNDAEAEQYADRGDCGQEAPRLLLLLPKSDKVTIPLEGN